MAEEAFSKRLDPIIETAGLRPKIRAVVKKEKATSSATGDTKSVKSYGGTFIRAVGPNSEGKLRSFPSQINYIEELDVFPQLLKGKGNPIEKNRKRATRSAHYAESITTHPKEKPHPKYSAHGSGRLAQIYVALSKMRQTTAF